MLRTSRRTGDLHQETSTLTERTLSSTESSSEMFSLEFSHHSDTKVILCVFFSPSLPVPITDSPLTTPSWRRFSKLMPFFISEPTDLWSSCLESRLVCLELVTQTVLSTLFHLPTCTQLTTPLRPLSPRDVLTLRLFLTSPLLLRMPVCTRDLRSLRNSSPLTRDFARTRDVDLPLSTPSYLPHGHVILIRISQIFLHLRLMMPRTTLARPVMIS
mmetsp:Transcript_24794/g.37900  ORF Transcript_24794/g.37900 Transcript_24794/m.37900 type:complete len:215 (-) Transcript_24794:1887-2531(-)